MPEPAAPTTASAPASASPAATPSSGGMTADQAIESFPRTFGPKPLPSDMLARIRSKAKPTGTLPYEDNKPSSDKPKEKASSSPPDPEASEERPGAPASEPASPEETAASEDAAPGQTEPGAEKTADPKKRSPWRVADHWKARATDLERQLAEAKKSAIPEAQAKDYTERVAKAEARAAELEKEIQFVNYEKSKDFQEKYHEPYAQAFRRAVAELSEVHVTDAQGNTRAATPEDILGLVSLPLGKAREVADAMFGAFADDAMAHRKEIKSLFDQRQTALEKARTEGVERAKQQQTQMAEMERKVGEAINEIWVRANQEAISDEEIKQYFTPKQDDPEWSNRLKSGYEMADKAFKMPNPKDPRLTPEQREEIITLHAAVRNRSAAFGAMRYRIEKLESALADKEKALKEYQSSEPGQSGGSRSKPTAQENGYTLETLGSRLRKYAK